MRAWTDITFPVVGGRVLPLQPPDAIQTGRFHHVPVLLGNNRHEMRLFVGLQYDLTGNPITPAQYEQTIHASYGPAADEVLQRYPLSAYPTPSIALATVLTDAPGALSTCSYLANSRAFTARPRPVPVYTFQFADRTGPPMINIPNFDEGAMHGTELPYLFPACSASRSTRDSRHRRRRWSGTGRTSLTR